ncbi:MAG: hypothetical protein CM15mP83_7980 [Flavobacteriaceae bacterium]|nr:MAG: hypothetical protein CM15mP83_7980 [Flavobacteriaceae bacterium]
MGMHLMAESMTLISSARTSILNGDSSLEVLFFINETDTVPLTSLCVWQLIKPSTIVLSTKK